MTQEWGSGLSPDVAQDHAMGIFNPGLPHAEYGLHPLSHVLAPFLHSFMTHGRYQPLVISHCSPRALSQTHGHSDAAGIPHTLKLLEHLGGVWPLLLPTSSCRDAL